MIAGKFADGKGSGILTAVPNITSVLAKGLTSGTNRRSFNTTMNVIPSITSVRRQAWGRVLFLATL